MSNNSTKKYYIKTFGCAANVADSERIASYLSEQGMKKTNNIKTADCIVINTCMVRESAENRVYGLINNLGKLKIENPPCRRAGCKLKIILTGCMVGMAVRDKSGRFLKLLKKRMPKVDEFLPIEEIGFNNEPVRTDKKQAFASISNGCNNFCTFCVVPYTRGRETSRPFQEIIDECQKLKKEGYQEIVLLGQNVNSYGADLIKNNSNRLNDLNHFIVNNRIHRQIKPVLVKHLGRYRIPTLFPSLLEKVAKMGFDKVDFLSSNPWDFSDELINVIVRNKNITRTIHLPVQSGDNEVLKKMNRWYTAEEYLRLISKIKTQSRRGGTKIKFTTDIIVGFCGETEKQFQNTIRLCKAVGFEKAYLAIYSDRPMTLAHKSYRDSVPFKEKKKRWQILENLINKPHLK